MASFQKITLIGNLGKDPETKTIPSGDIVNFSLAVNDRKKLADGTYQDQTQWYRISVFGKAAAFAATLRKGSSVYVEGPLAVREYTDKNQVKAISLDVTARELKALSPKAVTEDSAPAETGASRDSLMDDIPF